MINIIIADMKLKEFVFTICSILFVAIVVSCSQSGQSKSGDSEQNNSATENSSKSNEEQNLDFLKKYDGKYADEVHLFEKKIFTERLEKLIGTENFKMIKDDWTTLMPMEYAKDIFTAEGCKPHDCGANNYIIVHDFSEDVMYAGISNNEKAETFSENGKTSPKVEKWKPM